MSWELKKLFSTRWAALVMLAAVLANGVLFYRHCQDAGRGYTLAEIKEVYASPAGLEDRLTEMEELMWGQGSSISFDQLSDDFFREYHVVSATFERMRAARDYGQTLDGLLAENRLKLTSGLFGSGNDYAVRVLEESSRVYAGLRGLRPPVEFSGGVEVLADFHLTDIFLVLFAVLPALVLVTYERGEGLMLLTRPMRNGKSKLWGWKLCAMAATVTLGFLAMTLTNVSISAALLGLGDLARPIQSVYGYELCPEPLTVLGFLIELYGGRLLWALTVGCLFFALACVFDRPIGVWLCAGGAAAVAVVFQFSGSLWLRALSMSDMVFLEEYFQRYILLDFFGSLISERTASAGLCFILAVCATAAGAVAFNCRSPIISKKARPMTLKRGRPAGRHTRLFVHEWYKVFILHAAAGVLVLFILLQVLDYRDFYINKGEWETYYSSYSQALQGPPSQEKERYIATVEARFDEIRREDFGSSYDLDPRLRPEAAFKQAKQQYEDLRDGQWYLYKTGYRELFGPEGRKDDLVNTVKLMFVLVLCLSGLFVTERETGVITLQTASGKTRHVTRAKAICAAILTLSATAIAYLPRFIAVSRGYGGLLFSAPAISVDELASLPAGWTVGAALILITAVRLCLSAIAAGIILLVSGKSRNTVNAIGISLFVVCVPFAAALLI